MWGAPAVVCFSTLGWVSQFHALHSARWKAQRLRTSREAIPMINVTSIRLLRFAFYASLLIAFVAAILPSLPLSAAASGELQHISAFVVLSVLAWAAFPSTNVWQLAAVLCGFGALIELVQAIPALQRDASVYDWAIDCMTIAVCFGLFELKDRISRVKGE